MNRRNFLKTSSTALVAVTLIGPTALTNQIPTVRSLLDMVSAANKEGRLVDFLPTLQSILEENDNSVFYRFILGAGEEFNDARLFERACDFLIQNSPNLRKRLRESIKEKPPEEELAGYPDSFHTDDKEARKQWYEA